MDGAVSLLETEPDVIIDLEDVHRHFTSGSDVVRAIDGVSMRIRDGDFVTITGSSGCGKTTLLNLIGLLDSPTRGEVWIRGRKGTTLLQRDKSRIRLREIGFIFQFFNLQNNLTALENVMTPYWLAGHTRGESEKRAISLLGKVGVGHRKSHVPSELSGGQQQRVAIARALVNSPSVILADEPTGNLDSQTTAEIILLFEDLNREGQTIVMVTHEHDITGRTTRFFELKDGKVIRDEKREMG